MATTDRTPLGIAHLTVVPEGFDRDGDGRRADEDDVDPDSAA